MTTGGVLHRVRRRLDDGWARFRHRMGWPPAWPACRGIRPEFRHPVDASRREELLRLYRQRLAAAVQPEMKLAGEIRHHHRVRLLGHGMDLAGLDWARDPETGIHWSQDFSADIPYRGTARVGDIKLPWELAKHQYFFTLGKAAWNTGDPGYADEIVRHAAHFIAHHPPRHGIHWISALETGTRAVSWILAWPFLAPSLDDHHGPRMLEALAAHLRFVEGHLSLGRFTNTHLVGEAATLVLGGLFLDTPGSARWLSRGLAILAAEARRQVHPDGMHREQSVSYQRFFLDQYLLVQCFLLAAGRSLDPHTLQVVERMCAGLMDFLLPEGDAFAFGDADDARGIWLHARSPVDWRGQLALAAVLFGRPDLKAVSAGLSEEVLWLLGADGVARFDALAARLPAHTSAAFPDAGYWVLREGWNSGDAVAAFDCGPLGEGTSPHGHADALSLQLHAAGFDFLVDAGTFSYNQDYAWRDAFRGTRAHNCVVVDGMDQSQPADRLSWHSQAQARLHSWTSTPWFDLVDGEHDGYRRLPDPLLHRRVVLRLPGRQWWVIDRLQATASHEAELLWHARPDCRITLEDRQRFTLAAPGGVRLQACVLGGADASLRVLHGDEGERGAWFSPEYGTRLPSSAVSVRWRLAGTSALATGLALGRVPGACFALRDGCAELVTDDGCGGEVVVAYRLDPPGAARRPEGAAGTAAGAGDSADVAPAGGRWQAFDGELLFHHAAPDGKAVVVATGFRGLRLEGVVQVESLAPVRRLTLADGVCTLRLDKEAAAAPPVVRLPAGVRVEIERVQAPY